MRRVIERDREKVRKRYVASPRHTIQIDFYPYLRELERERRRKPRRRDRDIPLTTRLQPA